MTSARITVLSQNALQARQLFAAGGFPDFEQATFPDGSTVTFLFSYVGDSDMYRLVTTIPREMYALRAILG